MTDTDDTDDATTGPVSNTADSKRQESGVSRMGETDTSTETRADGTPATSTAEAGRHRGGHDHGVSRRTMLAGVSATMAALTGLAGAAGQPHSAATARTTTTDGPWGYGLGTYGTGSYGDPLPKSVDVTGDGRPATDPDRDGAFEDVTGDERFNLVDVTRFLDHYDSDVVQAHAEDFDFNGDGKVDVRDVGALLEEL